MRALEVTHALQYSINHKPVINRFATSGFVVAMNFCMALLLARINYMREKFEKNKRIDVIVNCYLVEVPCSSFLKC